MPQLLSLMYGVEKGGFLGMDPTVASWRPPLVLLEVESSAFPGTDREKEADTASGHDMSFPQEV